MTRTDPHRTAALVPPHAEMIAALQTRSRDMKTHLAKLKYATVARLDHVTRAH